MPQAPANIARDECVNKDEGRTRARSAPPTIELAAAEEVNLVGHAWPLVGCHIADKAGEAFPFFDLPGEQRNAVYRFLFDDITVPSHPMPDCGVRTGSPTHYEGKLAAYAALLQTCRIVKYEASSIFDNEYMPRITICFRDLDDFYSITKAASNASLKTSPAMFMLQTPKVQTVGGSLDYLLGVDIMKILVGSIFTQDLLNDEVLQFFYQDDYDFVDDDNRVLIKSFGVGADRAAVAVCDLKAAWLKSIMYPYIRLQYPKLATYACFEDGEQHLTDRIEGRFADLDWSRYGGPDVDEAIKAVSRVWASMAAKPDEPFLEGENLPSWYIDRRRRDEDGELWWRLPDDEDAE